MNAAVTRARAHALETARLTARGLLSRWSFTVEGGAVFAVVGPGASPVRLTAAVVAAGAVAEGLTDVTTTLPRAVAEDSALLLEGALLLRDAGAGVCDAFSV